jgi:hypothetical protein
MRRFLLIAAWCTLLSLGEQWVAVASDEILSEAAAQRCGLTRMWVTQSLVNRGQGRLESVVLCDGTIYAQSNRATLEAIDAETGQALWSKMVGRPDRPNLPPGACRDLVATINGSTLFVLNRYTGDILYQTTINGAPGGGPALSSKRAYVPMVTGLILSYRLEPVTDPAKELGKIDPRATEMSREEKKEAGKKAEEERRENIRIRQDSKAPLACSSAGRVLVAPVVTYQSPEEEFVTWGTDRGYLYVGRIDRRSEDSFVARYRLNSKGTFSSPPTYLPADPKVVGDSGLIFAGSSDGCVYALWERSGQLDWKFATLDPVIDAPVVIEDRVYVTTELGGMFCLYATKEKAGKQAWWAPDVLHFVAAGKQRIYAADKLGRLRILDARSGALLDILPTIAMPIKVSNGLTDRIYLATEGGVVQCLREVELTNPIVYNESRRLPPDEEATKPVVKPKPRPKSGDGGAPKVARDRPPAKKAATKKNDADGVFDAAVPAADAPAKPAKGKAGAKAAAKGKKGTAADAGGDSNPFGG